jgi:hypothetical protein
MILETNQWPSTSIAFLTLTYAPEKLSTSSIRKRDMQLFWKRLRESIQTPIRYFSCGEYGSKNGRPHYHAICWGLPNRAIRLSLARSHQTKSPIFKAWRNGFVTVRLPDIKNLRYVAKYTTKAAHERLKKKFYGIESELEPPWFLMSRRPGIGMNWLDQIAIGAMRSFSVSGYSSTQALDLLIAGSLPKEFWSFRHSGKKYPLDKVARDRIILRIKEMHHDKKVVHRPPRFTVPDCTWPREQEYCEQALLDRWIEQAKKDKVER